MQLVAKRRQTPEDDPAPKAKPNRFGKPLHVWLDPVLRDAIEALAERSRRTLTMEVSIALEKHLKEAGLWPPPATS